MSACSDFHADLTKAQSILINTEILQIILPEGDERSCGEDIKDKMNLCPDEYVKRNEVEGF